MSTYIDRLTVNVAQSDQSASLSVGTQALSVLVNNPTSVTVAVSLYRSQLPGTTPELSFTVEPYRGTIAVAGPWMYATVTTTGTDTASPTVQVFAFADVLQPGSWPLYPAPQTQTVALDQTVGNNGVLVNNEVANPVNIQPISGSPVSSAFVGLTTSWYDTLVINAVVQKIMVSTLNLSTSAPTASNQTLLIANQGSSSGGSYNPEYLLDMSDIPEQTTGTAVAGPFYVIDLSPGVYITTLATSTNTTASGTPAVALSALL